LFSTVVELLIGVIKMGIDLNFLADVADKIASKSPVRTKVGVVLFDNNGKIVATGFNHRAQGHTRLGNFTVYAEVDALSKVRKPSRNLNMIICRHGKKPIHACETCRKLIEIYEIKKVYQT